MPSEPHPGRWTAALVLAGMIAALVAVRLPVIYRQPGGHDEEYYAFPGLTIAEDGVPRMPHVPQRDPERIFYRADIAFFAEPPLYFYTQALFYAVLPHVYGTARLVSLVAGCLAIVMVYVLARRWSRDETIALWAAGVYSLLRMFYFTAITARPDLMCTLIGLFAVYAFDRWRAENRRGWFVASGVLIGLGGLTHPFAIVYAVQLAAWAFLTERRWRRMMMPFLLAGIAIATCALWLPLILRFPDEFRAQFGNNILHPAGPGLLSRFLSPWSSLARQVEVTWERARAIQFCLTAAGVLAATILDGRRRDGAQKPVWFSLSSIYLISLIIGQHPGYGYWSYAAAYFAMCLSSVGIPLWRRLMGAAAAKRWLAIPAGVVTVLVFVPGLGLRATWAYTSHWNDVEYNAPRFARMMMDDLPPDARYTVGIEYALDFYAAGRKTVIGETDAFYLESKDFPYDYLVAGPDGIGLKLPRTLNARLLQTYGRDEDPFACSAQVCVPDDAPD